MVFFSLIAKGQVSSEEELIDSSLWELVIPVEISSNRSQVGNVIELSRKDFLTMPASFDDPSRLIMKFPGFANSNDQNNGIIYHGMPDHFSGWSVNGAEILNPNHLSSAGRLFDSPASSAGGVNAFSGQVMGTFTYRSNPDIFTSNGYIAGTSDMSLRTPYRNQLTLNTSLLGIEAGLDLRKNKWSLMANFRNSTVGLLSDLGLDFGDEKITYQDVLLKLEYSNPVGWNVEVFQLVGVSKNEKIRPDIPFEEFTSLEQYIQKDLNGEILIGGLNIDKELDSGLFESSTNISHLIEKNEHDFTQTNTDETLTIISNSTSFSKTKNKGQVEFNLKSSLYFTPNSTFLDIASFQYSLVQPGIFFKYSPTLRWHFNAGMHQNYFKFRDLDIEENSMSPKLGITWISKNYRFKWSAKYNFTQQFFKRRVFYEPYFFPRSHNYSLELSDSKSNLTAQLFYHHLSQLVQDGFGSLYSSGLADSSTQNFGVFSSFTDESSARIYGVSLSYFETINSNTTISGNITLSQGRQKFEFNSFSQLDPLTSHIPLLSKYISNLSFSRKALWSENLDVQLGMHFRSSRNYKQSYDNNLDKKLPYYFRGDLRINYHFRKNANRFKSFLSLDIQNFTNRQNASYYFYDFFQEKELLDTQLGIIPVLSWRVVI